MNSYVDVVVVDTEFGKRIFEAPRFSGLSADDTVIVNTGAGDVQGTVIDVRSVSKDAREYQFIMNATNVTFPMRRVVARVTKMEFKYPEEVEDEQTDTEK